MTEFTRTFAEAFALETEREWGSLPVVTAEEQPRRGGTSSAFQSGTRWRRGLKEQEISAIERRNGLPFPPDYRLFLSTLDAPDRPMIRTRYSSEPRSGHELESTEWYGFTDWLHEDDPIEEGFRDVLEGIAFDIKQGIWSPAWGDEPDTLDDRVRHVEQLMRAAPKLLPVFEHRYLVGEPRVAGNPVLSIHQTDVIIYGEDLATYLETEFLGREYDVSEEGYRAARRLPFWGDSLQWRD